MIVSGPHLPFTFCDRHLVERECNTNPRKEKQSNMGNGIPGTTCRVYLDSVEN